MSAPFIPQNITVHLGAPNERAANVTLPFPDYIKNVASSEIYPTWPENALRANIYAIVTFALNRVYTEHYRSQGYDFDITNSTAFDQQFQPGNADGDQDNTDYLRQIQRLVEQQNAQHARAYNAHAGPHRIRRAERYLLQRRRRPLRRSS